MNINFDYAWCLEQKNELTEHLVETLTPYIYEGLTCIYKEAEILAKENNYEGRILLIFQKLLQAINTWNQIRINDETHRIKQLGNTTEYFDDLVKAVIKSNIILLTNAKNVSNVIAETFYNSFATSTFIHRCYTECGKDAHNYPYLFYKDPEQPMEYKRNQIIVTKNIQAAIPRAIRKVMPISLILKEYLASSIIIQEPSRVELIDLNGRMMETLPMLPTRLPQNPMYDNHQLPYQVDPKLEKEVMDIIKTESNKSNKQKVQALINMEKILTSLEPNKPGDMSIRVSSNKKSRNNFDAGQNNNHKQSIVSSISKKDLNFIIAPNLVEGDDNDFEKEFENRNLSSVDKKIININLGKESTIEGTSNRSLSATSLGSRGMYQGGAASHGKNSPRMNIDTSERIDPSKVNLIEDYGSQKNINRSKRGDRKN